MGKPNQASQVIVEDALSEAFSFIVETQRHWYPYDYKIRAGIAGKSDEPLVIRRMYSSSLDQMQEEDTNKLIYHFVPVEAYLEQTGDHNQDLQVLYLLAEDIVNQAEIMHPCNIREPEIDLDSM